MYINVRTSCQNILKITSRPLIPNLEMNLNVSKCTIDLDKTLPMGQAFRWEKDGENWIGVINKVLFKLTQTENQIKVESKSQKDLKDEDYLEILNHYFDIETNYQLPKNDQHFITALKDYGVGVRQVTNLRYIYLAVTIINIRKFLQTLYDLSETIAL